VEALGLSARFWRDRPTLVTGATGLVGSAVVARLKAWGADLVCLVRDWVPESEAVRSGALDELRVVRGDVRDQALLERVLGEYEVSTVLHLAAQTIVTVANCNPVSTFETNIAGTWALLEACRRSPRVSEIVLASSDKAYGEQADLPYREDAPLAGRHPYDVSKSCADLIAQTYAATYDLPVVVARCGNFFGPGDLNWNRIVPGTIRSVLRGDRPVIRSDGSYVRDYFYVDDGAAAYSLLAEKLAADQSLKGEAFNFSTGRELSAAEMVRLILAEMGSPLEPVVLSEATHEIARQSLDSSKARQRLGWLPLFSIEEGLRRSISWYTAFLRDRA
jgi:CDP-glucose 4,6-dehydratase